MINCILCAKPLLHEIEDEGHGERPEVLVCSAHSDQDLRDLGLDELWGGVAPKDSWAFFAGGSARVVGVWEQGSGGCFGVYVLLDDGRLLLFNPSCLSEIYMAQVPRHLRRLAEPEGVPRADGDPWRRASEERWVLRDAERLPNGNVVLRFPSKGTVRFSTEHYSWRELGDGRDFLTCEWKPASDDGIE